MAIDVRGFVGNQADYAGLYKDADTLMRQKEIEKSDELKKEAKKALSENRLSNYFDEKKYLTGEANDEVIVKKIDAALAKGRKLRDQGVSDTDMFASLSSDVSWLSEYSLKVKQVRKNAKMFAAAKKQEGGTYNPIAIEEGGVKMALTNPDGTVKEDLRDVDGGRNYGGDWLSENLYEGTTDKGFDELFKSILPQEIGGKTKTSVGGKSIEQEFKGKMYPWQRIKEENGSAVLDKYGNPVLEVDGDIHTDAKGVGHNAIRKEYRDSLYAVNRDLEDRVTGIVENYFKQATGGDKSKMPTKGDDAWDLQERTVLSDILKQRGGGSVSIQRRTDDGVRLYKPSEKKAESSFKGALDRKK